MAQNPEPLPTLVPNACPHTPSELKAITDRGRYLEEYDQAGWHATDAALGRSPNPPPSIRMYIAIKDDSKWTVYFGRLNGARTVFVPAIVAKEGASSTEYAASAAPAGETVPAALTAYALGIDNVRTLFGLVNRPYNIALYPLADSTFYVYLYPAQVKRNVYPIGGDERFHFSADGKTLLERHRMHKAVMDMGLPPRAPNGYTTVSDIHTDLYSNMPEDTDVFHVLAQFRAPLPGYVAAQNVLYQIDTTGAITCKGTFEPHS